MDKIDHFRNGYLLVLTEGEEVNDFVDCSGCHEGFAGPIYRCNDCKSYIHKSCTEHARQIQHFFHPCPLVFQERLSYEYTCNACFKHGSGFSYRCKRCDFNMHIKCALRAPIISKGKELILHFTHCHPLTLVDQKKDLAAWCGICEKRFSSSSNSSVYGCEECNFFLHNSCMSNIPQQIKHFFHPSCPLILLTTPFYRCASCDESGSGLAFRCGECDFQLDVKCALLPTVESESAENIQHFAHEHPLVLRKNKESDSEVGCRACGEKCLDPCFGCVKRSCNFFLHKSCAELPQEIHHPFHPLHPLTLPPFLQPDTDYDYSTCPSCLEMVGNNRFRLVCRCAKCKFVLHAYCAKPKLPLLKYGDHSHDLTFFDETHARIPCNLCHRDARSCFLRCVACEFNMHLYCHPLAPKTIKHKSHLHPLTLAQSPFEFELISPQYEDSPDDADAFYCDICEEKRLGFESVYYCEECKFIAEVPCVLSELLPSLTLSKDQSTVNGRAISTDEENCAMEATIIELNDEIGMLRAKEERMEEEIQKYQAAVKALQTELSPIKDKLKKLKIDHFLYNYQLDLALSK